MKTFNTTLLLTLAAASGFSQTLPEGTKFRVRMEETISSATAEEGQTVALSVANDVLVDSLVLIPEGSRVTGTILRAEPKKRLGRAGKLDFSVDRVVLSNGHTIPLRYTLNKRSGESHAVSTGIIAAGVAIVAWPVAPFVLLRHGKDVSVNKGITFEVFTDSTYSAMSISRSQPVPAAQP